MKALRVVLLLALLPLAAGLVVVTYQDAALTHYPARSVIAEELRAGRIPFLHPGASCGQPLAGNPNFGLFFPDTLLAILLPLPVAFGLRFALAAVLAFAGAHRWARAEGVPREAAEIAALAFVLSGVFLSTWRFFNSGLALAVAPWVLAAATKVCRRSGEGGGVPLRRAVAGLGFWGGLEILAGEPVIALLTFGTAMLRAAAAALDGARLEKRSARIGGGLLAGLALAGLIGAPQIAATAQILGDSSRERKPIPFVTATGTSVHPVRVLEQVVPFPYGRPDLRGPDGFSGHRFFENHPPYLWTLHVGLVLLALLARHGSWRRHGQGVLAALAVAAVALSLGRYLPGAKALYPFLSLGGRIRFPVKWWYVAALALVPLVGWAANRWLSGERPTRLRQVLLGGLGLVIAGGLVTGWPATALSAAGPIVSTALCGVLFTRQRNAAWLAWAVAGSLALCGLPLLLALVDVPPPPPPHLANGRIYTRLEAETHPRSPAASGEASSVTAFFRRASPELWALTAARGGMGYAFDLDPDGAYADEDRAIRKALDPLPWAERAAELRLAGVTTVIADESLPPPYRELAVLNPSLGVRAYGLENVAPSVRVATRVFRAPDLATLMATHRATDFDPRTDVVLHGPAASPAAPASSGRVLQGRESAAALEAEVEAASDAVVVFSRTFFSAWRASVDGRPAAAVRADGHLVGIAIPAGRHRVAVRWNGTPIYAGLVLAALGLLTAGALRRG